MNNNNNFAVDTIKSGIEGYVYLIHAKGTDRYKIGYSKNPPERLKFLKRQAPFELILVKTCYTPDMPTDKAFMHTEFSEFRANGEWFEINWNKTKIINSFYSITVFNLVITKKRQIEELGIDGIDPDNLSWQIAWDLSSDMFHFSIKDYYQYYLFVEKLYQVLVKKLERKVKFIYDLNLCSYAIGYLDSSTFIISKNKRRAIIVGSSAIFMQN